MFSAPAGCISTVLDYVLRRQQFHGVWHVFKVRVSRIQVFDNDEAGKKATSYLEKALRSKGIQVTSKMLFHYKDVNELLIAEEKGKE